MLLILPGCSDGGGGTSGTDGATPDADADDTPAAEAADTSAETATDAAEATTGDALPDTPAELPDAADTTPDLPGDSMDAIDATTGDPGQQQADLPLESDVIIWTDDCQELGVPKLWEGSWQGTVEYDVDTSGLIQTEQGIRDLDGTLSFEIGCVQSKFMVIGTMEGFVDIPNFDLVPFNLELRGFYDPETFALDADVIDGELNFIDIVKVFFIGELDGTLDTETTTFSGDWACEATHSNTPLVTGEATGVGTWNAHERVE